MVCKILCILALVTTVTSEVAYSSQYIHRFDGEPQLVYIRAPEHQHQEPIKHCQTEDGLEYDQTQTDYHQNQHHQEDHIYHKIAHSSQYVHRHDGPHQIAYINEHDKYHQQEEKQENHGLHETHSSQDTHRYKEPEQLTHAYEKLEHSTENEDNKNQLEQHKHTSQSEHNYVEQNHHEIARSSQYVHRHVTNAKLVYINEHGQDLNNNYHGKQEEHDIDYYAYPKYEFEYKVDDQHTGDHKQQHERRDGHDTKSDYSLHLEHIVPEKHHLHL